MDLTRQCPPCSLGAKGKAHRTLWEPRARLIPPLSLHSGTPRTHHTRVHTEKAPQHLYNVSTNSSACPTPPPFMDNALPKRRFVFCTFWTHGFCCPNILLSQFGLDYKWHLPALLGTWASCLDASLVGCISFEWL